MNYDATRKRNISLGRLKRLLPPLEYQRLLDDPNLSWCGRCKQLKPIDEFYKDSRRPGGVLSTCKKCMAERAHDWWERRSKDPEWRAKWNRRTQRIRDLSRERDPIKRQQQVKNTALKGMYGITLEEFNRLRDLQVDACAICRRKFGNTRETSAHVDHCHETKKVRGLLCNNCNNGLGRFGDDPQLLLNAAEYLRRTKTS